MSISIQPNATDSILPLGLELHVVSMMFVSWKSIIQPLLPHSSIFPGRSLVSIQFYSFYPKAQLFKGWIALSNEQIAIQWINVNKTYCAIHQITIYPLDNVIHFSNNKSVGKQRNYQREFSGLPKNNATSNIPQSLTSSWTLDLSIRSNALIIRVSPPSNDSAWNILRYLTYRAKQQIVCEQAPIRVALTLSTQTLVCKFSILFFIHSYGTDKENLPNNQDFLELAIISFILMTLMFESGMTLLREIKRCLSLVWVTGLWVSSRAELARRLNSKSLILSQVTFLMISSAAVPLGE